MVRVVQKKKNQDGIDGVNYAETLERARRRYAGEWLPVTRRDEEQTATTIHAVTCDFDRQMRLDLLAGVIAGLIAGIRSPEERAEVLERTLGVIRDYLRSASRKQIKHRPAKKKGGLIELQYECYRTCIDLSDIEATDLAFDRALRRRAGECLQITPEDVNGTYLLLRQLMTGVDLVVLVCVTAQAIAEEYDGQPPNEALSEFEDLIQKVIVGIDRMSTCDSLMH